MTYTIDKIVAVLKSKGYPVAEDDSKDYNLNLVGIRSNNQTPNSFDDLFTVFWKYHGMWTLRVFPCTTDPGSTWLLDKDGKGNPMGTAIMKEGYYKDLWHLGLHQGKYEALKQCSPVTVIRDFDKDNVLDFYAPDLTRFTKKEITSNGMKTVEWYDASNRLVWREQTGIIGLNGHRANENGKSIEVGSWSASCQVLQNRQISNPDNQIVKVYEFDYMMYLAKKYFATWRDKISYALINSRDFDSKPNIGIVDNNIA